MATESPKYSIVGLSNKIDWEGDVIAAIVYGIHASDIADEHVAELWAKAESLYSQLEPVINQIHDYIDDHYED